MTSANVSTVEPVEASPTHICIAANFTIEPIEQVLGYWLDLLGIPADLQFAPYNQVFQQLLEGGMLRANRGGINLVGLDLDSWVMDGPFKDARAQLEKTVAEFLGVLRNAGAQGISGVVLLFPSKTDSAAPNEQDAALANTRSSILFECASIPGWSALALNTAASLYSVEETHDPFTDELAHIPFTEEMYAAAATVAARWIRSILTKPRKVIVLDCDNTLWHGICGEGPAYVTPPYRKLHEFMLRQRDEGVLLAIASKNNEADVMAVLDSADCALKLDHFTSWQINWEPKSENLRAISEELGLALNSFLFLDDSPYECLEVRNSCPEVLTLPLPEEPEKIPAFLEHQWAFDHPTATEEDRHRASMYAAERQRTDLSKRAPTREEFLASLRIQINITRATEAELLRVAQLTQRTTQFNLTGVQHTSQSLAARLSQSNSECSTVRVSDAFGDYGLVGAVVFDTVGDSLRVDTFLLSCRALGRGVEDRMMDDLKLWAMERGAESVVIPFVPTARNRPALDFLSRYCDAPSAAKAPFEVVLSASGGESEWRLTAVAVNPVEISSKSSATSTGATAEADRLTRIAQLQTSEKILNSIRARKIPRPETAQDYVKPQKELEKMLAVIWSDCLSIEPIGLQDNFLDFGGTSLIATRILARIHSECGVKLGLSEVFEYPTVQQIAAHISALTVHAPGATVTFFTRSSTSPTRTT